MGITPGVETTTGPLGQGLANAVGMALAEALLAQEFNQADISIVDHKTFVFVGDGCLMEGISHEVCSLAGTLRLNKLIALYDDNGISIDGHVAGWFADDTPKRFEAYGWNVIRNVDGHDVTAIDAAIVQAAQSDRPTLICCKTVIGKGAPHKEGGEDVHGSPLGAQEIAATREALHWNHAPFEMPDEVYSAWDARPSGSLMEAEWQQRFAAYRNRYPEKAAEFERRINGQLPTGWAQATADLIKLAEQKAETIASRKASQQTIEALAAVLPEFLGGSADLTGSNLTNWKKAAPVVPSASGLRGQHVHYGVREFGMSAMINGIVLHGGYIAFGGTFLTFSDYSRNALRMAALMRLPSIFVFTHDSIGLGEDGPTHQAVEHVSSLRLIPNLDNWRPCDTVETACAWICAIERRNHRDKSIAQDTGPSTLVFSRQNLPFMPRQEEQVAAIRRGGYVLKDFFKPQVILKNVEERIQFLNLRHEPKPQAILIATGSEVALALKAAEILATENVFVRVVSMPSTTVFDRQDESYRDSVLLSGVPRIAIEAGVVDFWWKYVGQNGKVIGLNTFGESAPAADLFKHFGLTVEHIVEACKKLVLA